MASAVDICNLALAYLGDSATVSSLEPPEGSAQADHCATFYPMARDSLLEMHPWGFATRRVSLALLGSSGTDWRYTYAQPSDALSIIAVLSPNAIEDSAGTDGEKGGDFSCELDALGNNVILTNAAEASLRYTSVVTDTTKFTPLFTSALTWHLASMLAGPLLKGEVGAAESKRCVETMGMYLAKAIGSDATQRRIVPSHNVSWLQGR